jgi:hypothetical protein
MSRLSVGDERSILCRTGNPKNTRKGASCFYD